MERLELRNQLLIELEKFSTYSLEEISYIELITLFCRYRSEYPLIIRDSSLLDAMNHLYLTRKKCSDTTDSGLSNTGVPFPYVGVSLKDAEFSIRLLIP